MQFTTERKQHNNTSKHRNTNLTKKHAVPNYMYTCFSYSKVKISKNKKVIKLYI